MKNKKQMQSILKCYGKKYHEMESLLQDIDGEKSSNQREGYLTQVPVRVFIEPTNHCNKSCRYCAHESMIRSVQRLSLDSFDNIISGLPEGTYITMTGNGEPMLNPDIYEMIRRAVEKGYVVGMITNGTALTEKNARKLLETGIHRVQISFDAVDKEVYDNSYGEKTRGNLSYEAVLKKIVDFIYRARTEFRKKTPFITLAAVMTDEVRGVAEKNREFWGKMPVDNFYEGPLLSLQSNAGTCMKKDYTEKEEWKVCVNPFTSLKINADGSVNACIQDFSNRYSVGNVNDAPLSEIYNSERARNLRKALIEKDLEFLSKIGYHCHLCNAWTSEAQHDIAGYLSNSFPITYGLMIHEVDPDKAYGEEKMAFLREMYQNMK